MTMSQAVRTQVLGSPRAAAAKAGLLATAVAVGVVLFGTYADSSADSDQKSAAPVLVGIAVALGLIVFGLLAPAAIRAARAGAATGRRWGIGLTAAAVVSLVVFWTGAPVVLGTAAALTAAPMPRADRSRGVMLGLAIAVAVITVLWTILSNTVMS